MTVSASSTSGHLTCHCDGIKLSMVFTRQVTPHVTVSASSTSGHLTCHCVGINLSIVFTRQVTPHVTVSASSTSGHLTCHCDGIKLSIIFTRQVTPHVTVSALRTSGHLTCHCVGINLSIVFTRQVIPRVNVSASSCQVTPHVTVSASICRLSSHVRSSHVSTCRHQVRQVTSHFNKILTRLPSKQELRWLRTRKPLAYRESTCTKLSVSCPYEIIVYSVLKHINTARMHTISRQFIPLIYCSLGKRILSKIQPILPFH